MATRVRRTGTRVAGDTEAIRLAATLGQTVRHARRAAHMTLTDLARRVGIGASWLSDIERGRGTGVPLQTWVALGIAVRRPLAVSFTRPLGVGRAEPSGAGHLEIQEAVLGLARATRADRARSSCRLGQSTRADRRMSASATCHAASGSSSSVGTRSATSGRPREPRTARSPKRAVPGRMNGSRASGSSAPVQPTGSCSPDIPRSSPLRSRARAAAGLAR